MNSTLGSALDLSFESHGIRDLDTGQFTSVGSKMKKKVAQGWNSVSLASLTSPITELFENSANTSRIGALMTNLDDVAQRAFEGIESGFMRLGGVIKSSVVTALDTAKTTMMDFGSMGMSAFGQARKTIMGAVMSVWKFVTAQLNSIWTTVANSTAVTTLAGAYGTLTGSIWSALGSMWTFITTTSIADLNTKSLRASLASVALTGVPVISSVAGMATTFLGLASAEGVATAATLMLSAALSTIGWTQIVVALTAIVGVGAVLAGVLGNMAGASAGLGNAFNMLKGVLVNLFNMWMKQGVAVWNMTIDLLNMILSPVFAIMDGLNMVAKSLGLVSEEGSVSGAIFSFIADLAWLLVDGFSVLMDVFGGLFSFVGDVIYTAIITPFKILAVAVEQVVSVVSLLWEWFLKLPMVQKVIGYITKGVSILMDGFERLGQVIEGIFDGMVTGFEAVVNSAISGINKLIKQINKVPGVNIPTLDQWSAGSGEGPNNQLSGAKTSFGKVKGNAEKVGKKAESMMTGGHKTVNNNITRNEYNFGDFNMLPEEKARVKGLVKDALRQANRNKRLEGGHIG